MAREEGFTDVASTLEAAVQAANDRAARAPAEQERALLAAFSEQANVSPRAGVGGTSAERRARGGAGMDALGEVDEEDMDGEDDEQ